MMRHQLLLAPLVFSVFASVPTAPAVVFAPADGTTLTKRFVTHVEFALTDLSGSVNGDEEGLGMFGDPTEDMQGEYDETLVVSDQYVEVADGRPLELVRHFAEWSEESTDEPAEGDDGNVLERLLGTRVKFLWDEEEEEYETSFVGDEEGDEDDLAELEEDMDLRVLLPEDDVEEGDSWSIPLESMLQLLNAGRTYMPDDEDEIPEEVLDILGEAFGDAEIECTFDTTRTDDGVEVAVIQLSGNESASIDLCDLVTGLAADEMPEGVEIDCETFSVEMTIPIEGELLWNSESGHLHALELSTDVTVEIELAGTIGPAGMGMEIEANASFELSAEIDVTVGE